MEAISASGALVLPAAAVLAFAGLLAGVIVTLWRLVLDGKREVLRAKDDRIVDLETRANVQDGRLDRLRERLDTVYDGVLRANTEALIKFGERMERLEALWEGKR